MSEARLAAAEFARLYARGGMAAVEAEVARRFPQENKLQALHDRANSDHDRKQAGSVNRSEKQQPETPPIPQPRERSNGEVALEAQLVEAGLTFVTEYRFVLDRKWRLDFAFPEQKVAVEVQGAVHRIKSRYKSDIEKFNHLTLEGWAVLLFRAEHIRKGLAVPLIQEVLERRRST